MRKRIINTMLALAMVTSIVGCNNTSGLNTNPLSSAIESTASTFNVMSDESIATLKETNPDLAAQLEALKSLSAEERKTKIDELIAKYPELKLLQKGGMKKGGEFAKGGHEGGFGKGGMFLTEELKAKYPTLESELTAIKDLTGDERKTKMDELFVKYPELKPQAPALPTELTTKYPTIQAEFDAIKDLTQEERKTKMDELIVKYPELANFRGGHEGGFGREGFGKGGMFLTEELKAKYPTLESELAAIKDLTGDERKTKMDELIVKYPDLANIKKGPEGGEFGNKKNEGGFGKGGMMGNRGF